MHPRAKRVTLDLDPLAALEAWPARVPLAVAWSDARGGGRSPWTILALAGRVEHAIVPARAPTEPAPIGEPHALPFLGGWLGALSYELGHRFEPRSRHPAAPAGGWPEATWVRCDAAYVHDARDGSWWAVGTPADRERLPMLRAPTGQGARFALGRLRSDSGPREYQRRVRAAIDYIRSGDVYQVNLAHHLEGAMEGSARALFAALVRAASPWHGGYIEFEGWGGERRAIASASPELFLGRDGAGARLVTRPMKGTGLARLAHRLRDSDKERAELVMIVDLMRNDLGRVCELGSVRVDDERALERHGVGGALAQAVATVSGQPRPGLTLTDALAATFPPGSVTGAPKIRAMQIIGELERAPRGPYCGSLACLCDSGRWTLSVAIRTASIVGAPGDAPGEFASARLDYPVGAGIVADSDPACEWGETLLKAAPILAVRTRAPRGALTRA